MRIEKIDEKKGGDKIADNSRTTDEGQKEFRDLKPLASPKSGMKKKMAETSTC